MSDNEKRILGVLKKVIPTLSESGKERLLAFGEGMAFKVESEKHVQEKPA